MDPTWAHCPYCEAERSAREKKPPTGETRVDPSAQTRYVGSAGGAENARRLAGVLVTYSWQRQGQLFALYEGKNLIGSGACDVRIAGDPTLSHEHALIRCLGDHYEIFDQKSHNGTRTNDQHVPVHGMPLEDRATIKTGATVWTFLKVQAPAASEQRPVQSDSVDKAGST